DGAPIVPYAGGEDNEFDFANDRYGYGCPVGAHIRRANPRGSLASSRQLATEMNRHRILRRGRPYGDMMEYPFSGKSDEVDDRGLFFLCLNADLERQFEFINQNWVQGTAFAGLPIERDPLVGERSEGCRGFTIPGLPGPTRIDGLEQFVMVRGGEYFFLPGMRALRILAGIPLEEPAAHAPARVVDDDPPGTAALVAELEGQ